MANPSTDNAPEAATRLMPDSDRVQPAEEPPAPPLDSQRTIKGRFVLESLLGAGGMGSVHKARDLLGVEAHDRNPYVAIKVLGEQFRDHPDAFITLQREAKKTRALSHPNIVTVYDFDRDGDTVFLTMEYLDGESLDAVLKKSAGRPIAPERAWRIIHDIGEGLKRAHGQNIIHSDLKPANIFVLRDGSSKILDFGIARAAASKLKGGEETLFDAGTLGALTPAYASFAMMLGGAEPHFSDDIYAYACVIYELLRGQHPYQRRDAMRAKATGLKPDVIPELSKQQWNMLLRALSFDRAECPATIEEFLAEFLPDTTTAPTPNRTWVAVVSVVAILGAGIGAWFWYSAYLVQQQQALALQKQEAAWRAQLATAEQCLAQQNDSCAEANAAAVLAQVGNARAEAILQHIRDQRQRAAEHLAGLLTRLDACEQARDWACSEPIISEVLTLQPRNPRALDARAAHDAAAHQQRQQMDALMTQANTCLTQQDYACARDTAHQVLTREPTHQAASSLLTVVTEALTRQEHEVAKVNTIVNEGLRCLEVKRYDCAIAKAETALQLAPSHAKAQSLKKRAIAAQAAVKRKITIE